MLKRTPVPAATRHQRLVVLCYHSVHATLNFASATPGLFDEHLAWLREHCDVIPFTRIAQEIKNPQWRSRPAVAITFDDGYADNYEHALPLLKRYALPATFFITVGLVERDPGVMQRFSCLRSTDGRGITPLTWLQIAEMRAAGMEVGSHTWAHPNLAYVDQARVRFELLHSRRVLEERLTEPVPTIAFPFGKPGRHFTARTIEIARDCGYDAGASTISRAVFTGDCPLRIPRFIVAKDTVEILRRKVLGYSDAIGWWHEHAPPWIARFVSPDDFAVR